MMVISRIIEEKTPKKSNHVSRTNEKPVILAPPTNNHSRADGGRNLNHPNTCLYTIIKPLFLLTLLPNKIYSIVPYILILLDNSISISQ